MKVVPPVKRLVLVASTTAALGLVAGIVVTQASINQAAAYSVSEFYTDEEVGVFLRIAVQSASRSERWEITDSVGVYSYQEEWENINPVWRYRFRRAVMGEF